MKRALLWGTLALGLLHVVLLLAQVQKGAFYNGDAGLKLLMIQQFAEGEWGSTLELPHEAWEEPLWDAGMYPFGPPFVHETAEGRQVAFPEPFLLLSSFAYRAFGYYGLYVLPLLAVLLLWCSFQRTCGRVGLSPSAARAGLACLVLASPLTMYGAIVWEHSLACLLLFLGVGSAFAKLDGGDRAAASVGAGVGRQGVRWAQFGAGIVCGASAWIRSEAALLAAGLALVAVLRGKGGGARGGIHFALGVVLAGGILIGGNLALYGHGFGVESGLFEWQAASERYLDLLTALSARLVEVFPAALLALVGLPLLARDRDRSGLWSVGLALGFLLVVPLFLPNSGGKQWGPRYVLPLVPLLALSIGFLFDAARRSPARWTAPLVNSMLVGAVLLGAYRNLYQGTLHLREDYRERTLPAIQAVLASDSDTVVVNGQTIAQELAVAFGTKRFFLAKEPRQLELLSEALLEQGERGFLFLTKPKAAFRPSEGRVSFEGRDGKAKGLRFELLGQFGAYEIHAAEILAR